MKLAVSVHEIAEAEINEAADFYDLENPGLGSVFINEVQRAIESISEYPDAAPLIRERVRKRVVATFPYSLIYSVWGNEIRILAAAHQKRRPFYWRGRR